MIPARLSGLIGVGPRVGWSRRWYEGLGWRSARTDDVFVPFPLAGATFALAELDSLAPVVAAVVTGAGRFGGSALTMVVDDDADLDDVLAAVGSAGGTVVVPAEVQPWGRAAWFVDPAGTPWEVSWIRGRPPGVPFAGAPAPDAVATSFGGVILLGDDPDLQLKFYAEGLGWGPPTTIGGRPALALGGAWLAFAASDRPALRGALLAADDAEAGSLATALVTAGATASAPRLLTDPSGLEWEIVTSP